METEREGQADAARRQAAGREEPPWSARRKGSWALAMFVTSLAHALTRARAAEGWDGVGFLLSIGHFDLENFQPHPPGYPVYVLLLRASACLLRSPLEGATALSVLSLAVVAAAAYDLASRAGGHARGVAAILLVGSPPLLWRTATAIGSEAPGLAFLALAFVLLGRGRPGWAGALLGAALGVRLSFFPLGLSLWMLAPRGSQLRLAGAAASVVALWTAGLTIAAGGPAALAQAMLTQQRGHWSQWGGSALTEPGWARLGWLARDCLVDGFGLGLGGEGWALLGLMALIIFGQLYHPSYPSWIQASPPRPGWGRTALIVGIPYAAWVLVGQNLHQEPRHVAPLVLFLAFGAAILLAPGRAVLLAAALGVVGLREALLLREAPAAGAQLADYLNGRYRRGEALVYGGRSTRFLELTPGGPEGVGRPSMGDVVVDLPRRDRLPRAIFVTDELDNLARSPFPLQPVAAFCRPFWLDRRTPCLSLFQLTIPR